MKAVILDEKSEGESKCFLCKLSLEDYVEGLPDTYRNYEIQREIVSNVYLDHLVDTVLAKKHIPPISLVLDKYQKRANELTISSFKILDGLQRTFRLEAIRGTIAFCVTDLTFEEDYLSWSKYKLSRQYSEALSKINSNTDILKSILLFIKQHGKDELKKTFSANTQWFEIWSDLSPEEEVHKMLLLNAGHKPVNTRHQLELLFLNLLPILTKGEDWAFKLVREKEVKGFRFSKDRKAGSFHFAHIITSLLSFYDKKPVALSTGLIQDIQRKDLDIEEYEEITKPQFLKQFISFLVKLDDQITEHYKEVGVLWMGREVSLAGLFAALGAAADKTKETRQQIMDRFLKLEKANNTVLNLKDFEAERNNVDLSKVNFGNINRDAVFKGIEQLLTENPPKKLRWAQYFPKDAK